MKKKYTPKLVVDKFLTKKFRLANQHKLGCWLKEVAPEVHWIMGEIAFYSIHKQDDNKMDRIVYPFQLCIDRNNAKVEIAELDIYAYKQGKNESKDSLQYLENKKIHKVFKLDAINQENIESSDTIVRFLYPFLFDYVNKKWGVEVKC